MTWDQSTTTTKTVRSSGTVTWQGADGQIDMFTSDRFLEVEDSAGQNFVFGAGEFCIELFSFEFQTLAQPQALISRGGASPNWGWYITYEDISGNKLNFAYSSNGTVINSFNNSWTPVANTKYDICVERDSSSDVRMYIDGTMLGSKANITTTLHNPSVDMQISRLTSGSSFGGGINGLKAVRITDAARYASDSGYTVPTLPLPNQ